MANESSDNDKSDGKFNFLGRAGSNCCIREVKDIRGVNSYAKDSIMLLVTTSTTFYAAQPDEQFAEIRMYSTCSHKLQDCFRLPLASFEKGLYHDQTRRNIILSCLQAHY
jgi:hypothetical protein